MKDVNAVSQTAQRNEEFPWQECIHWTCKSTLNLCMLHFIVDVFHFQ